MDSEIKRELNKLIRGKSTKGERRFAELLKKLHIPFKTKVLIQGREVDFLISKFAIEISGHSQSVEKNFLLLNAGYTPLHLFNYQVTPALEEWLKKLWHSKTADRH